MQTHKCKADTSKQIRPSEGLETAQRQVTQQIPVACDVGPTQGEPSQGRALKHMDILGHRRDFQRESTELEAAKTVLGMKAGALGTLGGPQCTTEKCRCHDGITFLGQLPVPQQEVLANAENLLAPACKVWP